MFAIYVLTHLQNIDQFPAIYQRPKCLDKHLREVTSRPNLTPLYRWYEREECRVVPAGEVAVLCV